MAVYFLKSEDLGAALMVRAATEVCARSTAARGSPTDEITVWRNPDKSTATLIRPSKTPAPVRAKILERIAL